MKVNGLPYLSKVKIEALGCVNVGLVDPSVGIVGLLFNVFVTAP